MIIKFVVLYSINKVAKVNLLICDCTHDRLTAAHELLDYFFFMKVYKLYQ